MIEAIRQRVAQSSNSPHPVIISVLALLVTGTTALWLILTQSGLLILPLYLLDLFLATGISSHAYRVSADIVKDESFTLIRLSNPPPRAFILGFVEGLALRLRLVIALYVAFIVPLIVFGVIVLIGMIEVSTYLAVFVQAVGAILNGILLLILRGGWVAFALLVGFQANLASDATWAERVWANRRSMRGVPVVFLFTMLSRYFVFMIVASIVPTTPGEPIYMTNWQHVIASCVALLLMWFFWRQQFRMTVEWFTTMPRGGTIGNLLQRKRAREEDDDEE